MYMHRIASVDRSPSRGPLTLSHTTATTAATTTTTTAATTATTTTTATTISSQITHHSLPNHQTTTPLPAMFQ